MVVLHACPAPPLEPLLKHRILYISTVARAAHDRSQQHTGYQKQAGLSFGLYDHGETLERLAEVIEKMDFGLDFHL